MITKLIMRSFKSFKNVTTIDFTKTNYKVLDKHNVSDNGVLKGMMFVGANASGKSNALLAIRLLLDLLFMEKEINSGLFTCLFSETPEFSLDYYFKIDDKEIRYFFEFDAKKTMLSEKLYVDNKVLLERMGVTAKSYITHNENYNELDKETLFLRTVYFNTRFAGNETLRKWFDFLQCSIYLNAFDKQVISYGKQDFRITKYIEEKGTEEINKFFEDYNFDQSVDYANEAKGEHIVIKFHKDEEKMLFFKRKNINEPIPFSEESLGNRTLLNILPAFLFVVQHNGMLLIDEFSSGFHNELEELLVKYFMNTSKKSQMIFVSHSTNLLSTSLLRPDQIYSVEFDGQNGSRVKRFSDEQPRVAQNLEKMYLSGVFGGLPKYKDAYEN
ncbi:MAG: ATP-binding protein [Tissierellia bacterium]|jgi:AAA15 family ATPase/GTPase|nr:ATP-binding protein [Tissierellia bacterium]